MLLEPLAVYLQEIEAAIRGIADAHVEQYQEEVLGADRINLRIRVRFATGELLELNEAVVAEEGALRHMGYRYHYQDSADQLVFRYDDTPHFPAIGTFPHHKHTPDAVIAATRPSIIEVIAETTCGE